MNTAKTTIFFLCFLPLFLCSCVSIHPGTASRGGREHQFLQAIDSLAAGIEQKPEGIIQLLSPVAVVSGDAIRGGRYTRLDEFLVARITSRLQEKRQIYHLNGQNWFHFREHRPLLLANHYKNLIVYVVNLQPEPELGKIMISISAYNQELNTMPGLGATAEISLAADSIAAGMYQAAPSVNPYPVGLEENPYTSIDRLTYKLTVLLSDAYKKHFQNNPESAADAEINVLLHVQPAAGIPGRVLSDISNSLQQAIISQNTFSCALAGNDIPAFFQKIDFYRKNREIFETEDTLLSPGTILLMARVVPTGRERAGVFMRAVWLASPIETRGGGIFNINMAGTYLSGFTAKAFVNLQKVASAEGAGHKITTCLRDFPAPLRRQAILEISAFPGISRLEQQTELCHPRSPDCRCFSMVTQSPPATVVQWLSSRLSQGRVAPFTINTTKRQIDINYNGGFD